jgi:hypothetical protein
MDKGQLQADMEKVIRLLPPEIPLMLAQMVPRYWQQIAAKIPELKELVMPHFTAGSFEASIGVLDIDEVKGAIEGALMSTLPELAAAMQGIAADTDPATNAVDGS